MANSTADFDFRNSIYKTFKEYTPGEQPQESGWIKLNTNENPYAPSDEVRKTLIDMSSKTELFRKYPHALGEPLRSALAEAYGVKTENVLVANGSDEALALICKITLGPGETAATPEYTYSLYDTLVSATGAELIYAPSKQNFKANLDALADIPAKVIFFPNPNAPTGDLTPVEELERAVQKSKALWIIDEAYNDFADMPDASFINKLSSYPNAAVIRTFSKSHSLAALRIGYLISKNELLLSALRAAKDSYNEDMLALYLGKAAIGDREWLNKTASEVIKQRKFVSAELTAMGFDVLPSQANFVLVTPPSGFKAADILQKLKERKILIRHFHGKLEAMLRISIGSASENEALLSALKEILAPS